MAELFPPIEPYNTFRLDVSDGHNLYVEEVGDRSKPAIVFVHGGPGGGVLPEQRRFFNPEKWRVILFDQRGSGKSTPHASLENNTTWHLVEDMEHIRKHLNIDAWHVFGGSWGSTLSLAYAIKHPERVRGLVLRGIFTLRKSEIDWYYQSGAHHIYPDAWEKYLAPIPESEQNDLVNAYYKRLTNHDDSTRLEAAKAWSVWEGSTSQLKPDPELKVKFGEEAFATAFARIECHYFKHGGFFESDGWLIDNVDKIRHIPSVIVQGRYDMPCPMKTAWDLHKAWPEADFKIIDDAGHSASETGTASALVEACEKFAC